MSVIYALIESSISSAPRQREANAPILINDILPTNALTLPGFFSARKIIPIRATLQPCAPWSFRYEVGDKDGTRCLRDYEMKPIASFFQAEASNVEREVSGHVNISLRLRVNDRVVENMQHFALNSPNDFITIVDFLKNLTVFHNNNNINNQRLVQ